MCLSLRKFYTSIIISSSSPKSVEASSENIPSKATFQKTSPARQRFVRRTLVGRYRRGLRGFPAQRFSQCLCAFLAYRNFMAFYNFA
ncbi:hypothetical protein E2C01_026757 [Portunus trituberculatus]|uniref:Uncharacterized protein n=1 Tax=Portunus trituberculatus TaxID=210409 RepID=A0A5B7EJ79_PORTR|nr:hypothetical protein [Portunus trituberculatus]